MVLNNTVQGFFNCPTLWRGSCIIVMGAPGTFGTNGTLYPVIGGGIASVTSAATIRLIRSTASNYQHRLAAASAGSVASGAYADDAVYATCLALDQQNRYVQSLESDGTVLTGSALADTSVGVEGFHDTGAEGTVPYGARARFGNLSGTIADVVATGNTMVVCEMHFFKGILTAGDTTDVETELLALEAVYG